MALTTGYDPAQIEALCTRIGQTRQALRAFVPNEPLGELDLVCGCSDCIADADYRRLVSRSPATFTGRDIGAYFGGAGAVDAPETDEARTEAFAIYLHVLDHLADAVLASRDLERAYTRVHSFVEPSYWLEPLYATDLIDALDPAAAQKISRLLTDLTELGVARNHARLPDVLIYLSRATDRFRMVVDSFLYGPPRRHLAFWVAVAGWTPNSPAGRQNNGVSDFRRSFSFMKPEDRVFLEDALADPGRGALLERYAFAARDADWLGYLSRLVAWRENTIMRSRSNRAEATRGQVDRF